MPIETEPFDPADHLKSPEAQAELLADAFETGDPAYITNALGIVARARGVASVAKEAGVTKKALYKALSSEGNPRLSTLMGVMKAFGVKLSVDPGNQKTA